MKILAFCWLIVFVSVTVCGNVTFPVTDLNKEWWSNTIIYQIYPRSFKDSNNDGIGDLRGIIQKLDYFVDLGIETLWIGPIFKSPMDDMGYDVEDFKAIDPIYGTMDDFTELMSEMNKRNFKLITDIVPNHSSYKCEWFQKSTKREGKYTDYYVWLDAKNQGDILKNESITPIPPNNWLNMFGGSAWTWHTERKQFFFHQFSSKQPDFNIRNPEVQKEILDVMKFWLDKGVAGFRFDAVRHLYENASFPDEEYIKGKEGSLNYDDMIHTYTTDQPEIFEIIYSWREFMDDYVEKNKSFSRIISTESYSKVDILMKYFGNETKSGAQIPFNFAFVKIDRNHVVDNIDESINNWLNNLPKNTVANWVIENHDNVRIATKFGSEIVPLFTALKLALPGVEVTYYGGEIGMENAYVRPDQVQDPNNVGGSKTDETRDYGRCPMQWDNSINAGFTEARKPWLPINPNYYKLNVKMQKEIPTSNYNFYKKMAQLRKTNTLKYGNTQTYNISKSLFILTRSLPGFESYVIAFNFGSETETIILSDVVNNDKQLYVYIASENWNHSQRSSAGFTPRDSLTFRPQSVVVLTDNVLMANQTSNSAILTNTISPIGLLCTVLIILYQLNPSRVHIL